MVYVLTPTFTRIPAYLKCGHKRHTQFLSPSLGQLLHACDGGQKQAPKPVTLLPGGWLAVVTANAEEPEGLTRLTRIPDGKEIGNTRTTEAELPGTETIGRQ